MLPLRRCRLPATRAAAGYSLRAARRAVRHRRAMRATCDGFDRYADTSADQNADLQAAAARRCQALLRLDGQVQASQVDHRALHTIGSRNTTVELVAAVFELYADRPVCGSWDDTAGSFVTVTYRELWDVVVALASGLVAQGLQPGDFVGICGFSSMDWWICELACLYAGGVRVPLQTNLSTDDLQKIIDEAEIRVMCCSKEELGAVGSIIAQCPSIQQLLVIDVDQEKPTAQVLEKVRTNLPSTCTLAFLPDAVVAGRQSSRATMMIPGKDGWVQDPLVGLMYTSGSTGLPKGAMFPDSIWLQYWYWAVNTPDPLPQINLGFLPLNHLAGQLQMFRAVTTGGCIYFVRKPDMSTFFEDIALVRPTDMMIIPRFANMIYDRFQDGLDQISSGTDAEVARKWQDMIDDFREKTMGGRMLQATTGSAPTAPEVVAFLRHTLLIPIHETYGTTENGPTTADGILGASVMDWRLQDVPELGYYSTDRPYPRGELLIRTRTTIPGYYKQEKATQELFQDGLVRTGDIMEQHASNKLIWIDRRSNIMKLAQGEFVSVSRLEQEYIGASAMIHQMFIYGTSVRSYLLAIVVPSAEAMALVDGHANDLKAKLRYEIDDVARRKKLQGYEIPRDFIVEREPFSKANFLLTDSSKPARGKLKARYQGALEALYKTLEDRQAERRLAMRQAAADATVAEKVKQVAEALLGVDTADLGSSFMQLGGDSLAAVQFARGVSDACGVELPVSFVLDHAHSLTSIVDKVEALLYGEDKGELTFQSIHGKYPEAGGVIKAADLDLHRFIPAEQLAGWAGAAPAECLPAEPTVVLLTGANGFLGRFLLLDLLQRVSKRVGGRVVALVRGKSDDEARARLRAGYVGSDPELLGHFEQLSSSHLHVYAGDLNKPSLGLDPELYESLCKQVDTIVHNAALVNHTFTYEQLFEPNVLGSVEVMKFALQHRRKALAFLSSVGVAFGVPHDGPIQESQDGASLCTEHPGGPEGYAVGYGCSKWATEVQLRQLHEEFGVPVSVFRCGMILAHSRYVGQINATDFFTRLMASLAYTGIAPTSFYGPGVREKHFDGMPIDFVAAAICGVLSMNRSTFIMNHVVNPHWDDGISLDCITEWMQSGGVNISRIPDYSQWFQQFSAHLEKLDHQKRQSSALPLLHMWARPQEPEAEIKYDASEFRERVRHSTTYTDVPQLSEEFIHTNLRHMAALNIISYH